MKITIASNPALARKIWRDNSDRLPVDAVKWVMVAFPGSVVESFEIGEVGDESNDGL